MAETRADLRTAYDDPSTPQEMRADCEAADGALDLPKMARAAQREAPSIRFEDFTQDKGDIGMLAAAEHIARALELDLD